MAEVIAVAQRDAFDLMMDGAGLIGAAVAGAELVSVTPHSDRYGIERRALRQSG
jgi:hypothetical protein